MSSDSGTDLTPADVRDIARQEARDVYEMDVVDDDGESWSISKLVSRWEIDRRTALKAMGLIAIGYSAPIAVLRSMSQTAEAQTSQDLTVPGNVDVAGSLSANSGSISNNLSTGSVTTGAINNVIHIPDATASQIQSAIDSNAAGSTVVSHGNISPSTPIQLDKRFVWKHYGEIDASSSDAIHIGANATADGGTVEILGNITGGGRTDGNTAIYVNDATDWDINHQKIASIQKAYHIQSDASGIRPTGQEFHGGDIGAVDIAVHIETSGDLTQGNDFYNIPFFNTRKTVVVDAGSTSAQKPTLNTFYGCTFHGSTYSSHEAEIEENDPNNVIIDEGNLYDGCYISSNIRSSGVETFVGSYIRRLGKREMMVPDGLIIRDTVENPRVEFDTDETQLYDEFGSKTIGLSNKRATHYGIPQKPIDSKTISGGSITVSSAVTNVQPESGSSDTLTTVNGGEAGDEIILRGTGGNSITVADGSGNILLDGSADFTLNAADTVTLLYDGANWSEIARGNVN